VGRNVTLSISLLSLLSCKEPAPPALLFVKLLGSILSALPTHVQRLLWLTSVKSCCTAAYEGNAVGLMSTRSVYHEENFAIVHISSDMPSPNSELKMAYIYCSKYTLTMAKISNLKWCNRHAHVNVSLLGLDLCQRGWWIGTARFAREQNNLASKCACVHCVFLCKLVKTLYSHTWFGAIANHNQLCMAEHDALMYWEIREEDVQLNRTRTCFYLVCQARSCQFIGQIISMPFFFLFSLLNTCVFFGNTRTSTIILDLLQR